MNLNTMINNLFKSKTAVLILIILINLPLFIFTSDTGNFSDDYQLTNLFSVKGKFSPLIPLFLEPLSGDNQGGHFAPVYCLINYLLTFPTVDPRFFHFFIVTIFILTGFLLYLFVNSYYEDKALAILAAILFSTNYYISFKSLNWNAFHGHLTNTFLGLAGLYFLHLYIRKKNTWQFLLSLICFLAAVFDVESGMVFYFVLTIFAFFSFLGEKISLRKLMIILAALSVACSLFFAGSYIKTGKLVPLGHRLKMTRNVRGYAFNANKLFVQSTGLSQAYNRLIVDKLRADLQFKENIKLLVRQDKWPGLKNLSFRNKITLAALGSFSILFICFVALISYFRTQKKTRVFLYIYGCLFLLYIFVYYRADIGVALSIFGSIIIADIIMRLFRDNRDLYRWLAIAVLCLYFILTAWTIFDGFDGCYRDSFFGLPKAVAYGPNKIYDQMNKDIGHFAKDGTIIFSHDYTIFHSTTGQARIGDMISAGDFACYNATVFYAGLLTTDIPAGYKNKTFEEFADMFKSNPNNRVVKVSNIKEAERYLKDNAVLRGGPEAVYITKDYQVARLNND